ncbi:MAG: rhodanese-like domain-containing protein [Chloroflexota bacterium]
MKEWLWLVTLASLAVLLAGCGAANSGVTSADDVQRISPQDARALLEEGRAVLYDVRSADAYRIQHAAGALSFPEEEVTERVDQLPDDGRALIFYCT